MLAPEELDPLVREAANNAFDNGYQHWESSMALATDMATCDADLEEEDIVLLSESIDRQGILKKETVGYVIVRSPEEPHA